MKDLILVVFTHSAQAKLKKIANSMESVVSFEGEMMTSVVIPDKVT